MAKEPSKKAAASHEAAAKEAAGQPGEAAQPSDATNKTDSASAPAQAPEKKVENRARNLFSPAEDAVNPMPSLFGAPGLWKVIGAGGLPAKSFGGAGWADRINRNPGYLTITTFGTSGFVSLHRRVELDWQININRHILMQRADQLSFGQQTLVGSLRGGCPEPNCFPANLTPIVLYPGSGTLQLVPLLRDPHTGVLRNTAGFSNQYPWASLHTSDGVGEVVIGSRWTLKDFESEGTGLAVGIRPHLLIPTRYSTVNLSANGVQTGAYQAGADLLLEGHAGNTAGLYFNAGYTYVSHPKTGGSTAIGLYSYAPVRFGINIPRTSRLQFLAEYGAEFLVGGGTRDIAMGTVTDGTLGFRGYFARWFSVSAGYRHTLNHGQYGGDKNGFVVELAASYVPIERITAPTPPTVTCSAEPTTVRPGQEVRLSANASSTSGGTLTYSWNTTGGRIEGTGPTARLDTTGLAPGTYTVTVRVDDGRGGFADCTVQVTVEAPPPPPKPNPPTVTCSADKTSVGPGEVVTLTATASSPDNRPLNYDWSATGGRITGSGPTVRWDTTGASAGSYTATVRVTDDRGLSADCSSTVSIQAPPAPPRAAKLNECSFKVSSPRVDNKCKAVLDDVALRLQNEPDSRAAVVGSKTARERAANLGAQRASNVKAYLTREKGIDAGRVEVRTAPDDASKVEIWLIPRGASLSDVPGTAAEERMAPPARKARKAGAKKAAAPAEATPSEGAAKKGAAKKGAAKTP